MKLGRKRAQKYNNEEFYGFSKILKEKKINIKGRNKNFLNKLHGMKTWLLNDGVPYFSKLKSNEILFPEEDVGSKYFRAGEMYVDNINSFRLKKHIIRNKTRYQTFVKPNEHFTNFYNQNKLLFDEFDINVDKCVISKGCWHTNKHTLQSQLIPTIKNEFTGLPSKETLNKLFLKDFYTTKV